MTESPSATPTWIFERGADHMKIQRTLDRELLIVVQDATERRLEFPTTGDLVKYLVRFQDHLSDNGWTLVEFSPERRTGPRDRRRVQRSSVDRRQLPDPRWPT